MDACINNVDDLSMFDKKLGCTLVS